MTNYLVVGAETFDVSSFKVQRKMNALNFANFNVVGILDDTHINQFAELYLEDELVLEGYINEIVQLSPYQYQVNLLEFATELDTFYAHSGSDPDDYAAYTFITTGGSSVNTIVDALLNGAGSTWSRGSSNTQTTTPDGSAMPPIRFRFVQIRSAMEWFLQKYMSIYMWYSKDGADRKLYFADISSGSYDPTANGRVIHAVSINLTEEYRSYDAMGHGVDRIIIVDGAGKFASQYTDPSATSPYDTLTYKYNGTISEEAASALAYGIFIERGDPLNRVEFRIQDYHFEYNEGDKITVVFDGVSASHIIYDVVLTDGRTVIGSGAFKVSIFDMFGDKLTLMTGEGGTIAQSSSEFASAMVGQLTIAEE